MTLYTYEIKHDPRRDAVGNVSEKDAGYIEAATFFDANSRVKSLILNNGFEKVFYVKIQEVKNGR